MKVLLIVLVCLETLALAYLLAVPEEAPGAGNTRAPRIEEVRGDPESGPGETDAPTAASPREEAPAAAAKTEPRGTVFHGRITDAAGARLPVSVSCGLISPEGKVYEAFYREETGHFAHAEVPAGVYRFRALARGYATHDALMDVPAAGGYLEHSIRLRPLLVLPVRILTTEGKALREAVPTASAWLERSLGVVAMSGEPPLRLRPTHDAIHDSYGRGDYLPAERERDPKRKDGRDGTLRVQGELPVYVGVYLRRERLQVRRLDVVSDGLEFRIEPETVRALLSGVTFRLTGDGDPEQLEDVLVLLHDASTDEPDEAPIVREGDRITVKDQPPGDLHLQVHAGEDLAPYVRSVELTPGGVIDLGTIHLGALVRQTVRLVNAEEKPVIGATVWPYDLDVGWMAQRGTPIRFNSDASGRVRLALGAHRHGLLIREPGGGWLNAEIDLRETHPEVVEIPVPRLVSFAMRTGDVELPISVRILDDRGRIVTARRYKTPTIWPLALAPGDYTVLRTSRGGEERSVPLRIGASVTEMVVIE